MNQQVKTLKELLRKNLELKEIYHAEKSSDNKLQDRFEDLEKEIRNFNDNVPIKSIILKLRMCGDDTNKFNVLYHSLLDDLEQSFSQLTSTYNEENENFSKYVELLEFIVSQDEVIKK